MTNSIHLWADRLYRERCEEWASYEAYCREIEQCTGAEHASLVPSETHRKAQENLGLRHHYGLSELEFRKVLTKFSDETIRKAIREATSSQEP
jgi:hypothetical protein